MELATGLLKGSGILCADDCSSCNAPGLGIRLVIVLGAQPQTDLALKEREVEPEFVGGYRVTSGTLHSLSAGMVLLDQESD